MIRIWSVLSVHKAHKVWGSEVPLASRAASTHHRCQFILQLLRPVSPMVLA